MDLPEFVTMEEVKKTCSDLGIRDWTQLKDSNVTAEESAIILKALGVKDMEIDPEDFRRGLDVELEHGLIFPDTNITNNHPLLTAKVVLAHFKETLDYYQRLEVAEIEGDIFNAFNAKDSEKVYSKVGKLIQARAELSGLEKRKVSE